MTNPNDSLIGKTFDDYRIEKQLGAGGMAEIYRALDIRLKRYVAIKVIASDFRAHPDYSQRFEREAQSIARLDHPNIVHVYRYGETGGMHYIAMQYIEGADLATLIHDYKANGEVMPLRDIVRVIREIGAALDYVHSHDVIHRDVKPGNIMIDQEGHALLTDFGLALLGDIGTRGEVLGSSSYVSPEQAVSSANVVPQSDLYSLGITLFEMLTGEPPFTGDDPLSVTMRQISEAPPLPSSINSGLPPSIDGVVMQALEKEPFDRFASGADLSAALETAVANWQMNEGSKAGSSRRPSLVLLPHKVREQMLLSPLPAADVTPVSTRPAAPVESAATYDSQDAENYDQPQVMTQPGLRRWRGAFIFALVIFLIGAVLILALRLSSVNSTSTASESTEAAALPSPVQAENVAIVTVVVMITATIEPTQILPTPTAVPPTNTSVPPTLAPPTAALPPTVLPTLIPTLAIIPPTALPIVLLIVRQRNDGVVIANLSEVDLPLPPLRVGDRGAINGTDWGLDTLDSQECVVAWKDDRDDSQMQVDGCTRVGVLVTRRGPDRFWREDFDVYYDEVLVGTCSRDHESCSITLPQAMG